MTGPVDQGQTYRYRHIVKDSSGTLANAGTVTVTVTLPDGTTTNPTVSNTSTGVYDIAYTTSQVGLHNLFGSATGGVLGSEFDKWEDAFTVEEPKRMLIGVDEASEHLAATGIIVSDAQREKLRDICLMATDVTERALHRVIVRRTVTDTYDGGREQINLRSTPVISITSVTVSGTATTAYVLDASAGILHCGSASVEQTWTYGRQNVVVVSVAGYVNPPRITRLYARQVVQELWQESQQASHPLLDEQIEAAAGVAFGSLSLRHQREFDKLRAPGMA